MSEQVTKEEAADVIERLKAELGDRLSDMRARPLEGVTKEELKSNLEETLTELWVESGFKLVLRSKPEVEFVEEGFEVVARPKNESAKRLMQILNLMHPTHRIKRSENGKQEKSQKAKSGH